MKSISILFVLKKPKLNFYHLYNLETILTLFFDLFLLFLFGGKLISNWKNIEFFDQITNKLT